MQLSQRSETYAGLVTSDGDKLEAALDVIEETEVLVGLGNGEDIWRFETSDL
jgi:hypothetical protein